VDDLAGREAFIEGVVDEVAEWFGEFSDFAMNRFGVGIEVEGGTSGVSWVIAMSVFIRKKALETFREF